MKVLLIKDVHKLGRAGDVKKVADGFGRNYLLPQGLAVLATEGAMKQAGQIRKQAEVKRAVLNKEMSGLAEIVKDLVLVFPVKASETGRLYGSVTPQMIVDEILEKTGADVTRRAVDAEPIRELGQFQVPIRLTVDVIPEVTVVVHREGERPVMPGEEPEEEEGAEIEAEASEVEAAEAAPAAVEVEADETAAQVAEQEPAQPEPDAIEEEEA